MAHDYCRGDDIPERERYAYQDEQDDLAAEFRESVSRDSYPTAVSEFRSNIAQILKVTPQQLGEPTGETDKNGRPKFPNSVMECCLMETKPADEQVFALIENEPDHDEFPSVIKGIFRTAEAALEMKASCEKERAEKVDADDLTDEFGNDRVTWELETWTLQ